ncbi:hypothetical protein KY311_02720, partial [Candidatus Woesearchaeota archaeon]|nr:hypothetical protein [Candidatus Woesearchaeota archaeon]
LRPTMHMALNPLQQMERAFLNMYFLPPVPSKGKKKNQEPAPGFSEELARQREEFRKGNIPYQRILKGKDGWVYRM